MRKRILWFLVGLGLGLTAPAAADIQCVRSFTPTYAQDCGNKSTLQVYFEHHGVVPNRCKIA